MTTPAPTSAASGWRPLRRFIVADRRLAAWARRRPALAFAYEFVRFGVKQAWACLFGGLMLALLIGTHLWWPAHAWLYRYDFLTLAAVAIQLAMLATGLETREEAKVILAFHVTGTVMEVFKTAAGSWAYPEPSLLHWGGVPLFSGFMYAAVGSYIARAWRVFDFRFTHHPRPLPLAALGLAAYVNFFSHHFIPDIRLALFAVAAFLFRRTRIHYRIHTRHRTMPMLLGLVLVAVFIWFGENIGTYAGAWIYPHQAAHWSPVGPAKLGAWFLLMLVSYTMVALVQGIRPPIPIPPPFLQGRGRGWVAGPTPTASRTSRQTLVIAALLLATPAQAAQTLPIPGGTLHLAQVGSAEILTVWQHGRRTQATLPKDDDVARNSLGRTRLVGALPGHLLILSSEHASNPYGRDHQCGAGTETILRVIALRPLRQTFRQLVESCWRNVLESTLAWNPATRMLTVERTTVTATVVEHLRTHYRIAPDGTLETLQVERLP